jgi:predicted HNH restriction endonuclease
VHHIDKDRTNNTLKNLAWLCHNCHYLVHHDKLEMQRFLKSLKPQRHMVAMV